VNPNLEVYEERPLLHYTPGIAMKVFILALDGLEYDLVVKWQLRHLLQRTFGRFEVDKKYFIWKGGFGAPYSPLIWASFVTGQPPTIHGVDGFWTYRSRFLDFARKLPFVAKIGGKRRYLSKLGLKPSLRDRQDLKVKTMFDVVTPSTAIDVVSFNPMEDLRRRQSAAKTIDEFMEFAFHKFRIKKEILLEQLSKPWKLFMFYVALTDHAGHCLRAGKLKLIYQAMDALAAEIKEIIGPCIFLVVSDHGMTTRRWRKEYGTRLHVHSKHAFYSLNIKSEWKPSDAVDFYDKILHWTKL
jgi:hypothetical protein